MLVHLRAGLVQGLDRRARQLELPAGLEGHVRLALLQGDRAARLADELPAVAAGEALQQRPHAALALVGERPQVAVGVAELLVLGADPPVDLGLAAGLEERDQLVAVGDRLTLGFRWRRHAEPPGDGATGPGRPCPRSADRGLEVSLLLLSSLPQCGFAGRHATRAMGRAIDGRRAALQARPIGRRPRKEEAHWPVIVSPCCRATASARR